MHMWRSRRRRGNGSNVDGVRRRGRLVLGVCGATLVVALGTTGDAFAGSTAAASGRSTNPVWLCRPGASEDPCVYGLAVTAVEANGSQKSATWPSSPVASKFDCFYVYPTVSEKQAGNTDLNVTKGEVGAAVIEAAPFSRVCNVWAPVYRSQTWASVEKGLSGDETVMRSTFTVAYASLLSSWQTFLARDDDNRPIILIGDSQGSAILIHLISTEIDNEPSVLSRLVVAIIVGGNLQVPTGKTVGATFTKVSLCESATETGCAIAFSSYPSEPPVDSVFGRPGQGVSLQSGQTAKQGEQIACVNPAALGGGPADLAPYDLTLTQTNLKVSVSTPWVTYPNLYSARCDQGGGATWLQVSSLATKKDVRPVVSEGTAAAGTGATWGYHDSEFGLALGNLLQDVAGEETSWEAHH